MVKERKIWHNGKILPESEAVISIYDEHTMFGSAVFEMMRTFDRQTFKLSDHLDRLYASARYLEIDIPYSKYELLTAHENLLLENRHEFDDTDEIRSLINISRGSLPIYERIIPRGTQVMITCFPLKWVIPNAYKVYTEGVEAIIPSQRAIPAQLLEPKVKNRSRIHYKMADLEVKRQNPNAWALLIDPDGYLCEGAGSNVFIVKHRELYTPEPRNILRGISRKYVMELARRLKIEVFERNLELYDILEADEAFFTCTPWSIVPIISINRKTVGDGKPGRLTKYLTYKWSEDVGCDFINQVKGWQDA